MSNARKTTLEERIEIVKYCLESGNNYGETAIKYNVSYQQVYTWVKKYLELGEAGLEDRRGKRTVSQEPRTVEEELRIEIAKLKRELYITQVERDLLKNWRNWRGAMPFSNKTTPGISVHPILQSEVRRSG